MATCLSKCTPFLLPATGGEEASSENGPTPSTRDRRDEGEERRGARGRVLPEVSLAQGVPRTPREAQMASRAPLTRPRRPQGDQNCTKSWGHLGPGTPLATPDRGARAKGGPSARNERGGRGREERPAVGPRAAPGAERRRPGRGARATGGAQGPPVRREPRPRRRACSAPDLLLRHPSSPPAPPPPSPRRKKSTISVFRRFRPLGAVSGPRGLQKRTIAKPRGLQKRTTSAAVRKTIAARRQGKQCREFVR